MKFARFLLTAFILEAGIVEVALIVYVAMPVPLFPPPQHTIIYRHHRDGFILLEGSRITVVYKCHGCEERWIGTGELRDGKYEINWRLEEGKIVATGTYEIRSTPRPHLVGWYHQIGYRNSMIDHYEFKD